jgi:hypothetical protein
MATSVTVSHIFGDKGISTNGTAEILDAVDYRLMSLMIIAKDTNTSRVFYGGSDVASTTQLGIEPGGTVVITSARPFLLSSIYIDVAVNNEGVDFVGVRL